MLWIYVNMSSFHLIILFSVLLASFLPTNQLDQDNFDRPLPTEDWPSFEKISNEQSSSNIFNINRFARHLSDQINANINTSLNKSSEESKNSIKRTHHEDESAKDNNNSKILPTLRRIHLSAIHVDKAEFSLDRFLFKLTLRLALDSFSRQLEQEHGIKLLLSVRSANTCSHQFAGAIAAEEYYTKRARLFIVSGCDDAIRAVSRLASQWRVPVMTAAGFGLDLNNKSVHKTLIRVAFSLQAAVEFLFKLMKSFQWRRVNLIVDESDPHSLALRGSIERHLIELTLSSDQKSSLSVNSTPANENNHVSLNTISLDFQSLIQMDYEQGQEPKLSRNGFGNDTRKLTNSRGLESLNSMEIGTDEWPGRMLGRAVGDTLVQCSMYSRVSILLIPQHYLRKFMLSVYDQNMANGLYTFINLPLILSSSSSNNNDHQGKKQTASYAMSTGDSVFLWRSSRSARNAHAKQAFESLMSIYLKIPTTKAYIYYANRLNNLANTEYATTTSTTIAPHQIGINGTNQRPATNNERPGRLLQLDVNPYVASFYDSLQLYALALNESLNELKLPSHRAHLANSTYGETSLPFNLSSNLVSRAYNLHYKISERVKGRRYDNMVTGQISINQNGDRETDYTLDDMNQMTGKFAPVILYRGETRSIERLGRIQWSSDTSVGPTTDNVDCNFTNTCPSKPMTRFAFVMALIATLLVLIIGSLIYFTYSRLSLESRLVDYWWRLQLSDVEIILTRRKNANDGSIVMNSTTARTGSGTQVSGGVGTAVGSRSSHGHSSPKPPQAGALVSESGCSDGISETKMKISAGGRFQRSSTVATSANTSSVRCDKTEITKVTHATETSMGQWDRSCSAAHVCYGNITLALYKLAKVALKPVSKFQQSRKLMVELRNFKDIDHTNLCRFVGLIVDEGSWAIVNEFCPKGSLREFFHNESMVIDWTFKYSIINDILAGLTYLNSSSLGFHGRLKSSNCLVSARFVVKLSDYGPHSLYEQWNCSSWTSLFTQSSATGDKLDDEGSTNDGQSVKERINKETELLRKRIWLAPEHMSQSAKKVGSMKGDIYSLGLLLYEIMTNTLPFFDAEKNDFLLPLNSLYQELKNHGPNETTGPNIEDIVLSDEIQNIEPLVSLMKACWNFDPNKRPDLQMVNASLKKITRGVTSKKLLENLTTRMEQYTNNLESLVEAKLATLVEEKTKTEELLYQFVPKSIAALLREGQFIEPEAFECVTVFYSDIVGFTSLSSESSPMEVVDFLSELYLCFDETLEQRDIFKIDTIGDAYIVASGLPQRNGGKHVIEIACAALELRDRLRCFKIPHKPGRSLEMRVGIHSGPCIAGIVGGLNMPKYCVFGDTLTTGKFMESFGLPMKIHITEESKNLLSGIESFAIEQRQPKITRDGIPFQTYWLERREL